MITIFLYQFPFQTNFLFLGLIVGTIPLLLKTTNAKNEFKFKHIMFSLSAAIFTAMFTFVQNLNLISLSGNAGIGEIFTLIIIGMMVSVSMILPGLSAALMLIVLGVYEFLIASVSELNLFVLVFVSVGGVLGLAISGKLLKFLLKKHANLVNSICIGMVFGSIPVVYFNHGMSGNLLTIVTSIVTFIIGFFVVFLLNLKK